MTRRFRLRAARRLREREFEEAGTALAAATAALREAEERRLSLHTALTVGGRSVRPPTVSAGTLRDAEALQQGALHRQRLRAELEEATTEVAARHERVATARGAWTEAKARLRAVELLHERFLAELAREDARREQRELDDLAQRRRSGPGIGATSAPMSGGVR